jgi:c-di-GMP-binding flagellar brake protein YcgR
MTEEVDEQRDRKYPRVKETCNVKYHVVENSSLGTLQDRGVAVNISGGGMCFAADEAVTPGETVAMEMTLSQLPTPVVSLGKVVWCEQAADSDKFDVGVEFWWIGWADMEAQEKMLGYIHEKLDELGIDESGNPK